MTRISKTSAILIFNSAENALFDVIVCVSESDIMMQCECSHKIESSTSTTINYVDYNDPGNWSDYCNDNFRQILLQNPSHQIITYNFPKDSKNRRFSPIHYKRKLANGEEVFRSWLIYSTIKDAVFVFIASYLTKTARQP